METFVSQSSTDKSLPSHKKKIRNGKKNFRPSHPHARALHAPPGFLSFPFPPTRLSSLAPPYQPQPPLLPLPLPQPPIINEPRTRAPSFPPVDRKIINRSQDPTAKKNLKPQVKSSLVDLSGPDPSSLPLPTFFLRPRGGCNTEAAGINDGASDGLRRHLRPLIEENSNGSSR